VEWPRDCLFDDIVVEVLGREHPTSESAVAVPTLAAASACDPRRMTSTGQEVGRQRGSPSGRALVILLAWACLTGILIAVGVWVTHSSSVNGFDRHVTSVVVAHRTPVLDAVMKAVTWLGSWVALAATGILLVVLVFRRRLPVAVLLLAAVAWAGEAGGVTLAKHVVHRSRPPQDVRLVSAHGWSWPSGHTAIAIVVFTTVALVVTIITPSPAHRGIAWALGTLAVIAVAFSRVELGVHWTTDVIASTIFVAAWYLVLATVLASDIHPKTMRPTRTNPAEVRDDG
jgi:membrane-associated phospholipid phosphatase